MPANKKQTPETSSPVDGQTPDESAIIAEQTQPTTEAPNVDYDGQPLDTPTPQTELQQMVAERKRLDEQIKAAKASTLKVTQPTVNPLEKVIAKQQTQPKWLIDVLVGRVRARVQAGQSSDGALDSVLHQYRTLILAALAEGHDTEPSPAPEQEGSE